MPSTMSTSNAASPASAASPPVLAPSRPSTANKTLAPSPTSSLAPTIFTHKEWIIPPRPKPGRKPAADTPPTKRKAQNRQAQRAFRERKAARVGELEEHMKTMEEEDTREQNELRAHIHDFEAELRSQNELLLSWRQRMQELEATIMEERRLREVAENEVATFRNEQKPSTDAVPLRPRTLSGQKTQATSEGSFGESHALGSYENDQMGCGKCSLGTRCECIEQAFDIGDFTTNSSDAPGKRPHSPLSHEDNKRFRQDPSQEAQGDEIDFTTRFLSKRPPNLLTSASSTSLPPTATNPDPCGFCQDGTPCICAEMAMEAIKSQTRSGASIEQPHSSAPPSNPCINGPGTCAQCLSDANSTLFCKSLAASRSGHRPNQPPIAESLNDVSNEELPPTPSSNTDYPNSETNTTTQASTSLTLSCADAYEILNRHPAFDKASEELSTWMPQLATVPGGRERTAFEVEAASVMGVLRFFDRRFGRNAEKLGS